MQRRKVMGAISVQALWHACERLAGNGFPEATFAAIAGADSVISALVARRLTAAFVEVDALLEKGIHATFGVEPSTIAGSSYARRFQEGSETLRLAGIRTYGDLVRLFWWDWRLLADPPPEGQLSVMSVPEMNERTALALKRHLVDLKLVEPES